MIDFFQKRGNKMFSYVRRQLHLFWILTPVGQCLWHVSWLRTQAVWFVPYQYCKRRLLSSMEPLAAHIATASRGHRFIIWKTPTHAKPWRLIEQSSVICVRSSRRTCDMARWWLWKRFQLSCAGWFNHQNENGHSREWQWPWKSSVPASIT